MDERVSTFSGRFVIHPEVDGATVIEKNGEFRTYFRDGSAINGVPPGDLRFPPEFHAAAIVNEGAALKSAVSIDVSVEGDLVPDETVIDKVGHSAAPVVVRTNTVAEGAGESIPRPGGPAR